MCSTAKLPANCPLGVSSGSRLPGPYVSFYQLRTYGISGFVSSVPQPDVSRCSKITAPSDSLDHLVGAAEHGEGEGETEGLGSLQVEDKLDFRDLLYRQV